MHNSPGWKLISFAHRKTPLITQRGSSYTHIIVCVFAGRSRSGSRRRGYVVVGRCVIFSPGLDAVVTVAERLPVAPVPEQRPVATVWFDLIHISRPDVPAFFHALHTQLMSFQILLPCFLPCPSVTAGFGALHFLRVHRLVDIAVFRAVWHKRRTAGMPSWCVWS